MSHTRFRVNPHSIVVWILGSSLPEASAKSESEATASGVEPGKEIFIENTNTYRKENNWAMWKRASQWGWREQAQ